MTISETFLANLKTLMIERAITKAKLSRDSKVSDTHLDGILKGRIGLSLKIVERLCEAVNVDPIAMMEE
jgi:DNA-binding Xre family transcriptional regulator